MRPSSTTSTAGVVVRGVFAYVICMLPSIGAVIAVVVVIIAAIVSGRFPLLSNPGPEAGMVLAVVGGLAISIAGAVRGSRRNREGFVEDWHSGLFVAGFSVVVFLISTAIGAATSPSCSPNAGRWPMLLVAVPVLLLHAAVGPLVGRAVGRAGRAVGVVFLLCAASIGSIAFELYTEPGFRAASHLFVVVSGDLLQGAALPQSAIAFRAATALLAVVVALVGIAVWPAHKTRGLVSGAAGDSLPVWIAAVAVGVVFVIAHREARASLIPGRAAMEEAYSLVKQRGPLVVHADPLATTPRDVDAVLAEGTLWLDRLRDRLGPLSSDDIHLWLHADRSDQAHWTGAAHVDFAMPWRRELHVANARVPHGTLGHELAHIVAGEKSDTFLRVPSNFVVFHNAAVTEGLAMALTPELVVDQGLTLREQAAAMRQGGKAPPLSRLFSFSRFLGEEPGRAYVAAGALIESIVAGAGDAAPAAIARLYGGGGDLALVADGDVEALLARHEAALDALPLPPDAAGFAAARFRKGSVLDEVCDPDEVKVAHAVRARARGGDVRGAVADIEQIVGDDADGTYHDLLNDVRAAGDVAGAVQLLQRLVVLSPSPAERAVRMLALSMEQWRSGDERAAQATLEQIVVADATHDLQRQIIAARTFVDSAVRLQADAVVSRAALQFFIADGHTRDGARAVLAEALGKSGVQFVVDGMYTPPPVPTATPAVIPAAAPVASTDAGVPVDAGVADAGVVVVDVDAGVVVDAGVSADAPAAVPAVVVAAPVATVPAAPLPDHWAMSSTSKEPPAVLALALYVHARQLVVQGAARDAVSTLLPLVGSGLLVPVFAEQAVLGLASALARQAGQVASPSSSADLQTAERWLLRAADTAARPATRLLLRDRADRVARARLAPPVPAVVTTTSDPAWADRLLLGAWLDGGF